MLPGGVANPDFLRADEDAVAFVRAFFDQAKPVAAICHGPWTLIDAGVVRGRTLTSWPSLRTDLRNAGATWVDEEVHVDQGLVTSRNPDDLPAFCAKLVEEFAEGVHEGQRRSASAIARERAPRAAILDIDGTLVDTNYHHAIAWFRAFRRVRRDAAALPHPPPHRHGRRPAGRRPRRRRLRARARRRRRARRRASATWS